MIKGPVTKHLPLGAHRLGFSHAASKRVPMYEYVKELDDSKPIVFVVSIHLWLRSAMPFAEGVQFAST